MDPSSRDEEVGATPKDMGGKGLTGVKLSENIDESDRMLTRAPCDSDGALVDGQPAKTL